MPENDKPDIFSKIEHVLVKVALIGLLLVGIVKLLANEIGTLGFGK